MATKEQSTPNLITYSFPEEGVVVEAVDIEAAIKKLKPLKENK
jgi:hypothetical protein